MPKKISATAPQIEGKQYHIDLGVQDVQKGRLATSVLLPGDPARVSNPNWGVNNANRYEGIKLDDNGRPDVLISAPYHDYSSSYTNSGYVYGFTSTFSSSEAAWFSVRFDRSTEDCSISIPLC